MEIDNIVDDFFGEQNQRYQDMPASPIKPEAIAKMIQELHGQLQSRNRQSQRSERTTDLVSVGKAKATLTITADNFEWREGTQDNFRVDHFSEKATREKFIALYNQKKASQAAKTTTEKKELEIFQEIPDEVKYYDECFLKMANIASIQGLQELFAPNFVMNAYYFMTVSDSPGYASYILNYCIKNLTSHIPVGWHFAASDQKKEIDKAKFCECASIPEDDFEINLRLPEGEQKFDFTDETSLRELVDPILENTENSEGLGLMLFAHTSHEKTVQLKEKDLQKRLFKDILAALHLLADNGHLIVKIYTAFQRLSVELLFLLFALFEEVRIVKLNASHPRKLERFAVCTKFKQALGKELREKMASLLPKLSTDEFSKEDLGMFNLFLVKTSPDFAKFADGANKVFMQKLIEKLNQSKTSKSDKIDARQAKRLMGKWKLMELSESDISDQETDNRQQNYRNRGQYNNNDSRPPRDNRDNRDNRDFDGGRGRGGRGGFRGNRGGNRGGDYRRHDGSDDRQRRDRSDDRAMDRPRYDRDNRDNRDSRQNDRGRYDRSNDRHHNRDNRGYGGDRDRGGRGDRGKMTDEERFKRAEKKEVRQADIMNKDLSIPSFDVFGFIGLGGTGGGGKKGKEK